MAKSPFYELPIRKNLTFNKEAVAEVLAEQRFRVLNASQKKELDKKILNLFTKFSKAKELVDAFDVQNKVCISFFSRNIPFLIDSIVNMLRSHGINLLQVIATRACLMDDRGGKLEIAMPRLLIDAALPAEKKEQILDAIRKIIEDVDIAVKDWDDMKGHLMATSENIVKLITETDLELKYHEETQESILFLNWLVSKNYIFLGSFSTDLNRKIDPASINGLMKTHPEYKKLKDFIAFGNPDDFLILKIKKFNDQALVHRDVDMDLIMVKRFDIKTKKVVGYDYFIGFFSTAVYLQSAKQIPLIRSKLAEIMCKYAYNENNFSSKEFVKALELFPRDEFMQMEVDELYIIASTIVELTLVPKEKVFVRQSKDDKYFSVITFYPKEKFSTKVEQHILKFIKREYSVSISRKYTNIGDGPLARVHMIFKFNTEEHAEISADRIEQEIYTIISDWDDKFKDCMEEEFGAEESFLHYQSIIEHIPNKYKYEVEPKASIIDIKRLYIDAQQKRLFKFCVINKCEGELKIYDQGQSLTLSEFIPVLENMDLQVLDVTTYSFDTDVDGKKQLLSKYKIVPKCKTVKFTSDHPEKIEKILSDMDHSQLINDGFNALVVNGRLTVQEVRLFRAIAHYMRQIKFSLEERYIIEILNKYIKITLMLLQYFKIKFDPDLKDRKFNDDAILAELDSIESLSEDRVLRMVYTLLKAMKRTNYFQQPEEGKDRKPYLSFKIKSEEVPGIPHPIPYFEIFIFGKRVEGIHLRGGKVARGGLRLSDRPEDFRTEVLGLVKAQTPKNSVIVPVGSKGGFIVRDAHLYHTQEEKAKENVECYKMFLRGILDITDNLVQGKPVHPEDVVCYDEPDPYLVVAADKGTATFSDYANEISEEYSFWFGDAFASGGSYGYDHKKMGITAKGAWVSVTEHLKRLGMDVNQDPFTVIGIGDMSGDVFGNGMLLSKQIKLIAAFNHLHIFVDPNPDPAKSYKERARLFKLPRSNWADYNAKLISKGGGIFSRAAKSIELTKEMQEMLGTQVKKLAPDAFIKRLLKAEADLLWNGGIGTYVKSKAEANSTIGDKANDGLRVNGGEMKIRIIGEGGNLGMTQRGRMEYNAAGGLLNTDFIDNSAGVDCSDHEVNIKLAFAEQLKTGKLSFNKRNRLLEDMMEEVEDLVLHDNRLQNTIITIEEKRGIKRVIDHAWLIKLLEGEGDLNRELEFLPTDQEISAMRARNEEHGLTRPSISLLLSHSKNYIYKNASEIDFSDTVLYKPLLYSYFPELLQNKYSKLIENHKLANEIVTTILTNQIVNIAGICYYHQIMSESAPSIREFFLAFHFVLKLFDIEKYWELLQDSKIDSELKYDLQRMLQVVLGRDIRWILYNIKDIEKLYNHLDVYKSKVQKLMHEVDKSHKLTKLDKQYEHFSDLIDTNPWIKEILQRRVMINVLDMVHVSLKEKVSMQKVFDLYSKIGKRLQIDWVLEKVMMMESHNTIEKFAIKSLVSKLLDVYERIVIKYLKEQITDEALCQKSYDDMLDEIKLISNISPTSMLPVVIKKLERFL